MELCERSRSEINKRAPELNNCSYSEVPKHTLRLRLNIRPHDEALILSNVMSLMKELCHRPHSELKKYASWLSSALEF